MSGKSALTGRQDRAAAGGRPTTLLQLIRCWAAAIIVQQGLAWLFSVGLYTPLAGPERLESFTWRLVLLHIPAVLAVTAGVFAAARMHPEPGRSVRSWHLTAALGAPAVSLVFSLISVWGVANSEGLGMPVAAFLFGSAAALGIDHLLATGGRQPGDVPGITYARGPRYGGTWDRGATASEYLGVIVVVTALALAISGTEVGKDIRTAIECQVQKVTGGGGGCGGGDTEAGPVTDADYQPSECLVSTVTDKAGSKAKIAWFEWGNEYGFQQQTIQANEDVNDDGKIDENDQKVALTFTDAASIGVSGSGKPKLQVGKFGADEVELGAGITVTNGDTWVFDSEEEAEQFRDDIEEMKMWEMSTKYSGHPNIYGAYKWADKAEEIEEKLDDKHISYGKVGLDVEGSAGLKISAGDEEALSASLGGNFKFSPEATVTDNNVDGLTSYTYSATLEYGAGVKFEAGPLSVDSGEGATRAGTMTVSYDKETGELARIDMTQTIEGGISTDGAKGTGSDGKGEVSGSDGDASEIDVLTNTIIFEPGEEGEADRQIAEEWLDGSGDNTAPFAYMFGDHGLDERPGADDPFGQLMFDKGMSSKMKYDGTTDASEYGFEVSLGLSLGMSVSMEHKEEHISDAQFLGAPQGDQRSYMPYSYCAE